MANQAWRLALSRLPAVAWSLVVDAVALGGVGAILLGLHRLSPPAALIVGGALAAAVGVALHLAGRRP